MKALRAVMAASLLAVVFGVNFAGAEAPVSTIYVKGTSQYVGGNSALICESPAIQGGIVTSWKGLYLDLWGSFPPSGEKQSFCKEGPDVTLGFNKNFGENDANNIDVGLLYIHLTPKGAGDILSPFLRLSHKFNLGAHTLSPYVKLELYKGLERNNPKGGMILVGGIVYNWQFSDPVSFKLGAAFKLDNGAFGKRQTGLVELKPELNYQASKNLTLRVPWVQFTAPTKNLKNDPKDGRGPQLAVGTGVSYKIDWSDLFK